MNHLPKWIWGGAAMLAYNAGWVNAIGLLSYHMPVSHATGNMTNAAIDFSPAVNDISSASHLTLWVLFAFFIGAVISGVIIYNEHLSAGRRYGCALVLEAIFLIIAMILQLDKNIYCLLIYAMACGLQNAMVATYSGSVIRTSHVTGLVSDFGSQIGNLLSGKPFNKNQVKLHGTILISYASGAWISSYVYNINLFFCLLVPIVITLLAALIYIFRIQAKYCIHSKQ
ncbi:MAG: YoaK family protein [Lentisphaeria bacterium]